MINVPVTFISYEGVRVWCIMKSRTDEYIEGATGFKWYGARDIEFL